MRRRLDLAPGFHPEQKLSTTHAIRYVRIRNLRAAPTGCPRANGGTDHGQPTHPQRSLSLPDDPYRSNLAGDEIRRQSRLDNELQADPELAEGPASGGKIAVFAIAIAVVLGAVFYGLNNSSINQAGTSSTAQNTHRRHRRRRLANQPSPPQRLRACVT